MEDALRTLNELVRLGMVENDAIGGAVAAAFYLGAMQPEDVDAFVLLPLSGSGLICLGPV